MHHLLQTLELVSKNNTKNIFLILEMVRLLSLHAFGPFFPILCYEMRHDFVWWQHRVAFDLRAVSLYWEFGILVVLEKCRDSVHLVLIRIDLELCDCNFNCYI